MIGVNIGVVIGCYDYGKTNVQIGYIVLPTVFAIIMVPISLCFLKTARKLTGCGIMVLVLMIVFVPLSIGVFGGFTGWLSDQYYTVLNLPIVHVNASELYHMYETDQLKNGLVVYFDSDTYLLSECAGDWESSEEENDSDGDYIEKSYYHLAPIVDCEQCNNTTVQVIATAPIGHNAGFSWDPSIRQATVQLFYGAYLEEGFPKMTRACPFITNVTIDYLVVTWESHDSDIAAKKKSFNAMYTSSLVVPTVIYALTACCLPFCTKRY